MWYNNITNFFTSWKNNPGLESLTPRQINAKKVSDYLAKVQLTRLRVDIGRWRESIQEAEQAYYPHRVKMQAIFKDTILNGQVFSAMEKRKDLTLLKGFVIKKGDKIDEEATKLLKKQWFSDLLNYIFDAKFYGYSLIALNDMQDYKFPNLEVIKRWHVSPDRHNITPFQYSLNGIQFLDKDAKDSNGNSFFDSTIWIDTPTETGDSNCGYGLLYKAAYYEILIRNNTGYNATALELFGQAVRVGKTTKTDEAERQQFFQDLMDMGHNAAILLDEGADSVELQFPSSQAGKNQGFDNFEKRAEAKISKLFFGHESAMDSIAGKLGGEDGAIEAIENVQKKDVQWLEEIVNSEVLPKLINYGLPIPLGASFCFLNDKEEQEEKRVKSASNKEIAETVQTFSNAGYEIDEAWIEKETGIPIKKKEVEEKPIMTGVAGPGLKKAVTETLNKLYGVKEKGN